MKETDPFAFPGTNSRKLAKLLSDAARLTAEGFFADPSALLRFYTERIPECVSQGITKRQLFACLILAMSHAGRAISVRSALEEADKLIYQTEAPEDDPEDTTEAPYQPST